MIKNLLNKGFTLIETLVAISVLMIAIAGPLTVANKGYTASIDSRNQSQALYLAQEGLEYINYLKDNRLWGSWTPGTNFLSAKNDTIPDICVNGTENPSCTLDSILPTPLPSSFTGRYYITTYPQLFDQISVSVIVYYSTGSLTNSVKLEQVLSNYER